MHSSTGVAYDTRELFVAGTPPGTKDVARAHAQAKAEQPQCAVQKLLSLPLPAKRTFAFLEGSLQHRVAHLPHVSRWSAVEGALSAAADAVADAALQIGNCQVSPGSEDDACMPAQLNLPMRHGAMGLHRLSPAEGSAAFLSSAAFTHVAMEGAPAQFRPFDGPNGKGLRQKWQALRHHVCVEDPHGRSLIVCVFATCYQKPGKTRLTPPPPAACGDLPRSMMGVDF